MLIAQGDSGLLDGALETILPFGGTAVLIAVLGKFMIGLFNLASEANTRTDKMATASVDKANEQLDAANKRMSELEVRWQARLKGMEDRLEKQRVDIDNFAHERAMWAIEKSQHKHEREQWTRERAKLEARIAHLEELVEETEH